MVSLVIAAGNKSPNGGKLVFHRYGSQYFLSEILCDQASMDVQVPASKTERRVGSSKQCLTQAARLSLLPGNGVTWSRRARSPKSPGLPAGSSVHFGVTQAKFAQNLIPFVAPGH